MTRPTEALWLAVRDFYANSWRLVPVNAALGLLLAAVAAATLANRAALVLVVLAGPLVAALVHCSVTLVRTENLCFADAVEGLRLHWRRGLVLGGLGALLAGVGIVAIDFYVRSSEAWPLAFVALYLLVLVGIYQLVLWTLAIAAPEQPLRAVARETARLFARRPAATVLLGLALLIVNAAGIAAAVMPFLTITVAYSCVATAHFALPRPLEEEAS